MPSRRTLRTATRACSEYLLAILVISTRRSSDSAGMGTRINWPSDAGLRPNSAVRIAFSTAPARPRSQTCTVIIRGSGTPMVATWLSGVDAP